MKFLPTSGISISLSIEIRQTGWVGATMHTSVRLLLAAGAALLAIGQVGARAEQVGEAVLIKTSVTGDGRVLAKKSPVNRDERIRTSNTGLGEFVFRDGTKFAVGWNSSVIIDKFVFNDSKSVKDLTVNAAKGSFRWISGGSPSTAYKINTPAGTVGIRGTAFDMYVGSGGVTAIVLLTGRVRFCGASGCRDLHKRCDFIVATPGGNVSQPARVSTNALKQLNNSRALPFVTGNQKLSGRFQVGNDCLVTGTTNSNKTQKASTSTPAPSPNPEPSPEPSPSKGNNGIGNGAGDGSPNGRGDSDR